MLVDVVFGLPRERLERLVVVDVFRSSTAIVKALENGAVEIIPCSSIAEAKRLKRKLGSNTLLVGERMGITPKNFDLNISPSLLTRERVEGRRIIYCSTNLMKVVSRNLDSKLLLIGGLINASAVAKYLNRLNPEKITIVACGLIPDKMITMEDVIGAGAIISRLIDAELTDTAIISRLAYENDEWRRIIPNSYIANYLRSIGWGQDIEICLNEDSSNIVPILVDGVIKGVRVD